MHYQQSKLVKVKKVGDSTALYSPQKKGIHVLNETSLFVWELLQEPFTFDEIFFMLGEVYIGNEIKMKKDLQEVLDKFIEYELVITET